MVFHIFTIKTLFFGILTSLLIKIALTNSPGPARCHPPSATPPPGATPEAEQPGTSINRGPRG